MQRCNQNKNALMLNAWARHTEIVTNGQNKNHTLSTRGSVTLSQNELLVVVVNGVFANWPILCVVCCQKGTKKLVRVRCAHFRFHCLVQPQVTASVHQGFMSYVSNACAQLCSCSMCPKDVVSRAQYMPSFSDSDSEFFFCVCSFYSSTSRTAYRTQRGTARTCESELYLAITKEPP